MVKIARRPEGQANQPPEGRRPRMARWPSKGERVTLTATYGAGGSCWFRVQGRGRSFWVTGDQALLDVVRTVIGEVSHV